MLILKHQQLKGPFRVSFKTKPSGKIMLARAVCPGEHHNEASTVIVQLSVCSSCEQKEGRTLLSG